MAGETVCTPGTSGGEGDSELDGLTAGGPCGLGSVFGIGGSPYTGKFVTFELMQERWLLY